MSLILDYNFHLLKKNVAIVIKDKDVYCPGNGDIPDQA